MSNFIIIGATNSGKGTIANYLIKKHNLCHLPLGHILRRDFFNNTDYKFPEKRHNTGFFMTSEEIINVVDNFLDSNDLSNGVIIDGFPRTAKQSEELDNVLKRHNLSEPIFIKMVITDEEVIKRSYNRYTCKDCSTPYNKETKPTKVEGVCDHCGSTNLYVRYENSAEEIHRKLERYYKTEEEAIKELVSQNKIIHEIDACQSIEDIRNQVDEIVDKY